MTCFDSPRSFQWSPHSLVLFVYGHVFSCVYLARWIASMMTTPSGCPSPRCILRKSVRWCVSGGISSINGVVAFNARKTGVFAVLCVFLQGVEPLRRCEVRQDSRVLLSAPFKRGKTLLHLQLGKIPLFWRSVQGLRAEAWPLLWKSCVCSKVFPYESDHAGAGRGCVCPLTTLLLFGK